MPKLKPSARSRWGAALKAAMKRAGVSCARLARECGLANEREVYHWRSGKHLPRPSQERAIRKLVPGVPPMPPRRRPSAKRKK